MARSAPLALVALLCTACPFPEGTPSGGSAPSPGDGAGAGSSGGGVPIQTPGGTALCSDDLAATTFRFAACMCDDAAMTARVVTTSYSSSDLDAPGAGGGLAANGDISGSGDFEIGGSLVAGRAVRSAGRWVVSGDLLAGRDLDFSGAGAVGGDVYVGGDLTAIALDVGGAVHANDDASVFGGGGAVIREAVAVAPPCPCGDDARLDVAAIVEAAATSNDNAANAIDQHGLRDVAGAIDLVLPPGRFYFSQVVAAGAVRLTVSGPTAIFVDGDLALSGMLEVVLDGPDASIDLFIRDDLLSAAYLELGSVLAPSKVRLYVGGSGDIAIAGTAGLGASIFAPDADVTLAGAFVFNGALVAHSLIHSGALIINYDSDVLDGAGEDCGLDDDGPTDGDVGTCASAADCGNQACVEGACGACASNLDCAAPFACVSGTCIPIAG